MLRRAPHRSIDLAALGADCVAFSAHEAGTHTLPGAVAFAAVCRTLSGAGWARIVVHEAALAERVASRPAPPP